MGFKTGHLLEKPRHSPNSGICPGFGVKTPDTMDMVDFDMGEVQLFHKNPYLPFYLGRQFVLHRQKL